MNVLKLIVLGLVLGFASCSSENVETVPTDNTDTTANEANEAEPAVNPNGDSQLTLYMRGMEEHMAEVRKSIVENNIVNPTMESNFSAIYEVEASPHVERDDRFHELGDAFLARYSEMMNNSLSDSNAHYFNATVDACITCHKSYCPGPIVRIKKLLVE